MCLVIIDVLLLIIFSESLSMNDMSLYLGILHQLSSHLQVTRSRYDDVDDDESDDDLMETDDKVNISYFLG